MRKRGDVLFFAVLFTSVVLSMVIGCSSSDDNHYVPPATYNISGAVSGDTAVGVTINLTGDATATTTTATDGTYSFTGLEVGNYTVIPVKAGYTFDPLSSGGHLTANQTDVDFTATANTGLTYNISGEVSGDVLAGVTITLTGDATGETITNASGNYSFPGILLNGNYTVTPSLTGYTFNPTSTGVIVSGADETGVDFTATANAALTYSISGQVTGGTIAGVTITLSGGTFGTAITTTDGNGNYSFPGLVAGIYTVTPSLTGYTFSPANRSITLSANSTGNDFASSVVAGTFIHSISGTVTGATGVTINLTGAATDSKTGGSFSFTGLANGAYTVTPVLAGYTFAPSSSAVTVAGGNITDTDFIATANAASKYSISGTVSGEVKSGVTITLSGAGSGTTTTNASGNYSFSGLVNGSYTVTPSLAGYTFAPTHLDETVAADITGANFVATAVPTAYTQADLTGTWNVHMLKTGSDNKWSRGILTFNSSGNLTAASSCLDSTGDTTCPAAGDLQWTINASSGVISEGGNDPDDEVHMTMTANKNFIAGTSGQTGGSNAKLRIIQKVVSGTVYSNADLQSKSFVFHQLEAGSANEWSYGAGATDANRAVTMNSKTSPSGTEVPGATGTTLSVTADGVVTISDEVSFNGFLSNDKKTIVGTSTYDSGSTFELLIIQIAGQTYPAGALPAGTSVAHMLAGGSSPAPFWVHDTVTVASGGVMSFSDWVSSNAAVTAPGTTYHGSITAPGTVTVTEIPSYHGQVSDDGKFTVGTQTIAAGVYSLQVNTK